MPVILTSLIMIEEGRIVSGDDTMIVNGIKEKVFISCFLSKESVMLLCVWGPLVIICVCEHTAASYKKCMHVIVTYLTNL